MISRNEVGFKERINMSTKEKITIKNLKHERSVGVWLIVIAIIGLLNLPSGKKISWIVFYFVLFVLGCARLMRYKRFTLYYSLIMNSGLRNLTEIVKQSGQQRDPDLVAKDINKMINKHYLDANYDTVKRRIRLSGCSAKEASEQHSATRIVKCSGCGAEVRIISGEATKCEYCGKVIA